MDWHRYIVYKYVHLILVVTKRPSHPVIRLSKTELFQSCTPYFGVKPCSPKSLTPNVATVLDQIIAELFEQTNGDCARQSMPCNSLFRLNIGSSGINANIIEPES